MSIHTASTTVINWRQYFPFILSSDQRTARVGWEEDENNGDHQWTVGYDVEVKKIGERWLPVECRKVKSDGGLFRLIEMPDDRAFVAPDE